MKEFGRWLSDSTIPASAPAPAPTSELPEGIAEQNGKLIAFCAGCHNYTELVCDVTEIPMTGYVHYCGASPRCLP